MKVILIALGLTCCAASPTIPIDKVKTLNDAITILGKPDKIVVEYFKDSSFVITTQYKKYKELISFFWTDCEISFVCPEQFSTKLDLTLCQYNYNMHCNVQPSVQQSVEQQIEQIINNAVLPGQIKW